MEKEIGQPEFDMQEALDALLNAEPEVVTVGGKERRIGWLRHGVERKFTHIAMSKDKDDPRKRNVKLAACLLLNGRSGFWTMVRERLLWPLYWRWLYYVVDVDMAECAAVMEAGKKKSQLTGCLLCTTSATGLLDVLMTMRTEEVRRGRAVPGGAG